MNLAKICTQTCALAREVGIFIRDEAGKVGSQDIEVKYANNFVSYVDKTAEIQLVSGLQKIFPDAGFIVEEGSVARSDNEFQWVVDPLDGTTNFLYNIPSYAISIGLMQGNKVIMGVVYEINRSECFYAWGTGAYRNGKPIKVGTAATLKDSFMSTGFPYYDFEVVDNYCELLKHLMHNSRGIRRLGAAAIDLCYVACGNYDAYFEHSLSPWDVAAGSFIVQQAGGRVCDFDGGDDYVFGRRVIATNGNVFPVFSEKVKEYLGTEALSRK